MKKYLYFFVAVAMAMTLFENTFGANCLRNPDDSHICNGKRNCEDFSDERNCSSCPGNRPHRCACNKIGDFTCSGNYSCYSDAKMCNGINDCGDFTDELNCASCPAAIPNRCACNRPGNFTCKGGFSCFSYSDPMSTCSDGSHIREHVDCSTGEFECNCHKSSKDTCDADGGCISSAKLYDGRSDCPDGSDESIYRRRMKCWYCDVDIWRLDNVDECKRIGFPDCDNSTCYKTPALNCTSLHCNETNVICTSFCAYRFCDKTVFQCEDGSLQLLFNFCYIDEDKEVDAVCPDKSDKIRDGFGFRCSSGISSCVLPQRNLYDDVAQCRDGSDLCSEDGNCFTCLDQRLIVSAKQVCDGIIDCYDLSDECLCDRGFDAPICTAMFSANNASALQCTEVDQNCLNVTEVDLEKARCKAGDNYKPAFSGQNRFSHHSSAPCNSTTQTSIIPTYCDGRPECIDFSDECNCSDLPAFCSDGCRSLLSAGDRYCDGFIDPSWESINDTRCPEGFDEFNCSKRFMCESKGRISIDVSRVCDGIEDCVNGTDEESCHRRSKISSSTELVENTPLRYTIFVMGFFALIANVYVIVCTMRDLKEDSFTEIRYVRNGMVLCLFIANFLMGVYFLIISVKSWQYLGEYKKFDLEWRTSVMCDVTGSLAFFTVAANCLFVILLTCFLWCCASNSFSEKSQIIFQIFIGLVWIAAFLVAVIPFIPTNTNYFIRSIWFSNIFSNSREVSLSKVETFACRLASLSNVSIVDHGSSWTSALTFLDNNFPEYLPNHEVGYYGDTSVCLPRIFIQYGDKAWGYTLAFVTIIALLHLAAGIVCVIIYCLSSRRDSSLRLDDHADKKVAFRIFRFVIIDAILWMIICVITYVTLSGASMHNDVMASLLLLTLFCVINPLLYSNMLTSWKKT